MTNVEAVKTYFSKDSSPVENREMLEFFKGMAASEKNYYGEACAKALGETWTPSNPTA